LGSASAVVYPNPVTNDATTIQFVLPSASRTTITIFDALGRSVMIPENRWFSQGEQSVRFDTRTLTNGTYFYELSAPDAGVDARGAFTVLH
jgi:hypothetical protein